ncbi:MAG TPA: hypothetical protein VII27_02600 [Thermoplasmata archaeon]
MAFVDRLPRFPILLEVVPPHRRASDKAVANLVQRIQDAVRTLPHVDALNLPEVLDENHVGRPFYRNLDPRLFAKMLNDGFPVEPVVNKVVVHMGDARAFEAWARESLDRYGLRSFVLAGGTSSRTPYPGPDVEAANRILRSAAKGRRDVACGNITIAERPGEVERLLRKTRAGAQFFTSQVLFEPEPIRSVLREYGDACAADGLEPATVLLSFAPVSDYEDVEFLAWLGATITSETEDALLDHKGLEPGEASFEVARSIWTRIRDGNASARHPVPLGVNIEEISVHNFDLAVRMVRGFSAWRDAKSP